LWPAGPCLYLLHRGQHGTAWLSSALRMAAGGERASLAMCHRTNNCATDPRPASTQHLHPASSQATTQAPANARAGAKTRAPPACRGASISLERAGPTSRCLANSAAASAGARAHSARRSAPRDLQSRQLCSRLAHQTRTARPRRPAPPRSQGRPGAARRAASSSCDQARAPPPHARPLATGPQHFPCDAAAASAGAGPPRPDGRPRVRCSAGYPPPRLGQGRDDVRGQQVQLVGRARAGSAARGPQLRFGRPLAGRLDACARRTVWTGRMEPEKRRAASAGPGRR